MSKERITLANPSDDLLLYTSLDYLRSLDPDERTSVVAGIHCLETDEFIVATSLRFRREDTNRITWNHAEHQVLEMIPANALDADGRLKDPEAYRFVSSLSPCVHPSTMRFHNSCLSLLVGLGLTGEFTGKVDKNANKHNAYEKQGFTSELTTNEDLLRVCETLYIYFRPFKKKGWTKDFITEWALGQLPASFTDTVVGTA